MPNLVLNLLRSVVWSMVSNAALKSKRILVVYIYHCQKTDKYHSVSYRELSYKNASFYMLTEGG